MTRGRFGDDNPGYDVEVPTMRRFAGWLDEPPPPTEPMRTSPAWPLIDPDEITLPILQRVLNGLRAL